MQRDRIGYRKIFHDTIYGLIVGDTIGVPYKYDTKAQCKQYPCVDMVGYGTFLLPPGSWSTYSLQCLNAVNDLIKNNTVNKYDGLCENIFYNEVDDSEIADYNKGSYYNENDIMTFVIPYYLYYFWTIKDNYKSIQDELNQIDILLNNKTSKEKVIAYGLLFSIMKHLLSTYFDKYTCVQNGINEAICYYSGDSEFDNNIQKFYEFRDINFLKEPDENNEDIISVLKIAIWCFLKTNCYHDCVLNAINFGGNTNGAGAISGALAGLYYGNLCIPLEWKLCLNNDSLIDRICDKAEEMFEYEWRKRI